MLVGLGGILGLKPVCPQSSESPRRCTTELVGTMFGIRWSHPRQAGLTLGKGFLEKMVSTMTW